MSVTEEQSRFYHNKLPIDPDEKLLAVYKHHAFAYILPLIIALFIIGVTLGLTVLMTRSDGISGEPIISSDYQQVAYLIAGAFSIAVLVFTYIPIWLRLQERLILTDEAILQVLHTSLFTDKVSQTSLARIADVSVNQDFLGNVFGYGRLTIETPGEQNNYIYPYLGDPQTAARQIIEAHENFAAALESGRLPTTLGNSSSAAPATTPQTITVDPQQYQEFLRYQEQQSRQNGQNQ